jgi:hypothetical protein
LSIDNTDAPPPPPPPPPPPDYSAADQPVIDEGQAAPDDGSSPSADVGAARPDTPDVARRGTLDNLPDPAPADVPVVDEGQATPDLLPAETSSPSLGADAAAPGSAERGPDPDQAGVTTTDQAAGGGQIDDTPPASVVANERDPMRDIGNTHGELDSGTALDGETPASSPEYVDAAPPDLGQQTSASEDATRADSSDRTDEPDSVVADAKAIELDTNAGSAYYGPNDAVMREAAQEVNPEAGYHTVDMHGSADDSDHVYFQSENGALESLSADQLADVIRDNDNWDGQPVRLFSCWTGQDPPGGGDAFGQQLADSLGVEVRAPTTPISNDSYGNPVLLGGGEWRTFQPRKL